MELENPVCDRCNLLTLYGGLFMELAKIIGHLVDRVCIILFLATLAFIGLHFIGFVSSGRFRSRFRSRED